MARLFIYVVVLAVFVAIVLFVVSLLQRAASAGQAALRPMFGPDRGSLMAPTPIQKVAFVALFALMLGVCTGWLGGL